MFDIIKAYCFLTERLSVKVDQQEANSTWEMRKCVPWLYTGES